MKLTRFWGGLMSNVYDNIDTYMAYSATKIKHWMLTSQTESLTNTNYSLTKVRKKV